MIFIWYSREQAWFDKPQFVLVQPSTSQFVPIQMTIWLLRLGLDCSRYLQDSAFGPSPHWICICILQSHTGSDQIDQLRVLSKNHAGSREKGLKGFLRHALNCFIRLRLCRLELWHFDAACWPTTHLSHPERVPKSDHFWTNEVLISDLTQGRRSTWTVCLDRCHRIILISNRLFFVNPDDNGLSGWQGHSCKKAECSHTLSRLNIRIPSWQHILQGWSCKQNHEIRILSRRKRLFPSHHSHCRHLKSTCVFSMSCMMLSLDIITGWYWILSVSVKKVLQAYERLQLRAREVVMDTPYVRVRNHLLEYENAEGLCLRQLVQWLTAGKHVRPFPRSHRVVSPTSLCRTSHVCWQ